MKSVKLGNTDLTVSRIGFGTMLFGSQNTEQQSHELCNLAVEKGINFFDTAEMYGPHARQSVDSDQFGAAESILGNWLQTQARDKIYISTKVTGVAEVNTGSTHEGWYSSERIMAAIENSLRRLKTDYIDLYQIHWPARASNFFHIRFSPELDQYFSSYYGAQNYEVILQTLTLAQKQGKIRHYGISNESSWGVCKYQNTARELGVAPMSTVQNGYSLVNREFERDMRETCYREGVGLIAFSPLSFGVLTNKYTGANSEQGRMNDEYYMKHSARYFRQIALEAANEYANLARDAGVTATQLALAWVASRNFVNALIIGAKTTEQLSQNITALDQPLAEHMPSELESAVNKIYEYYGDAAR